MLLITKLIVGPGAHALMGLCAQTLTARMSSGTTSRSAVRIAETSGGRCCLLRQLWAGAWAYVGGRCLPLLLLLLCQRHDDLEAGRSQLLHGGQV